MTFSQNIIDKHSDIVVKLHNILKAFTKRNFSIGYCQGFNIIVWTLLQIYSDEVFMGK